MLDLGSGGGIDVLLSARRVAPGGIAGALTEDEVVAGLEDAGFEGISIEPTKVFGRAELNGLAAGLTPTDVPADLDVEQALREVEGVIRSAFIRAAKPGRGGAEDSSEPLIQLALADTSEDTACGCGPLGCN